MGSVESLYLLRLARDRSATGRRAFADAFSQTFLDDGEIVSVEERQLMFDILHRVVHDIEMSLRKTVSAQLAKAKDVPRGLAVALANDELEVAYPILTLSTVLLDEDLIEVVRNRSVEHQLVVAKRPNIGEGVSDALVETGNQDVIRTLLSNQSARITSATMRYLVDESKRINAYQEPILYRADLNPQLVQRMVYWVSAALRQYILDNFEVDAETVDDALEASALDIITAAPPVHPPHKAHDLARVLDEEGAITPELLVSALQTGETRLFVALFGRLTGLKEKLVMDMLTDPRGQGLAIACKASEIGKAHFTEIYAHVRRTLGRQEDRLQEQVRIALDHYEKVTLAEAKEVMRRLRRDMGFLAAIRDLRNG
jgi:uncharacterized protein (DUF2336 family)